MKNTLITTTACLGLLAVPLSANFRINFDTDATGPIVGGGDGYTMYGATAGAFTGTGTLDPDIVTGTNNDQITALGNGAVLSADIIDDGNTHGFNPEVIRMDTTFGLQGGTSDVEFARNGSYWKGWNVDGFSAGVNELTLTSVMSLPVHGRTTGTTLLDGGRPWGISTSLLAAGTGLDIDNFNITYTISDLYYLSDHTDPATSVSNITPAAATAYASTGWENVNLSNTELMFESTNGFDGIESGGGADNLLVRGLNEDGSGNLTSDDTRSFYATTFEVTITPIGNDINGDPVTSFASDTRFVFSYDGDRTTVLPPTLIPEPTSGLLVSLAGLGLIARRKR